MNVCIFLMAKNVSQIIWGLCWWIMHSYFLQDFLQSSSFIKQRCKAKTEKLKISSRPEHCWGWCSFYNLRLLVTLIHRRLLSESFTFRNLTWIFNKKRIVTKNSSLSVCVSGLMNATQAQSKEHAGIIWEKNFFFFFWN